MSIMNGRHNVFFLVRGAVRFKDGVAGCGLTVAELLVEGSHGNVAQLRVRRPVLRQPHRIHRRRRLLATACDTTTTHDSSLSPNVELGQNARCFKKAVQTVSTSLVCSRALTARGDGCRRIIREAVNQSKGSRPCRGHIVHRVPPIVPDRMGHFSVKSQVAFISQSDI